MPRVSVITPTYNHERYIDECIRSVLAQTFTDWEMIIVDDGSTDKTAEIIKSFGDQRIKYLHQENAGITRLANTYNRALTASTGEVIGILEGDDYWPRDKLAFQVPDFDDDVVVLSSGQTAIDVGEKSLEIGLIPTEMPTEEVRNNQPVGIAVKHMVSQRSLTYTFPVSTMISARALKKIGGFQQPSYLLVTDFPTFLRLTIEGEFRFHEHILGYWRRHRNSVTLSRMPEILEGAYRYAFEFLREHRDRVPLTDAELDAIQQHWDEVNAMSCILRGRLLSGQGSPGWAARAFREAKLYHPGMKTRFFAGVAAMLCSVGLPVEPIYRLTGRVPLDKATTIDTGDSIVSVNDMQRARFVGRWRK
jgi:glycosyltransferase involved in cell wall biosynthesis